MISKSFKKSIKVGQEHLDHLNHVNNVVFLQWVQDVAGDHWDEVTGNRYDDNFYWVVVNHFIEYKGQAFEGDVLTAKTYIEQNVGVKSTRIVEFYKNEKLIVTAKTNWALIDKKRERLVRVPQEIVELFFES